MKRLSIADLKAKKEADVIQKLEAIKGGDASNCHFSGPCCPIGSEGGGGGSTPDPKD